LLDENSEGSAFDDYDFENGYINEEEEFEKNKDKYTALLFQIYDINIKNHNATFEECEETDILAYIDYLCYKIDYPDKKQEESEVR
jgi:hypothetical protein